MTVTQAIEDATLTLLAVVFGSLAVDCMALPENASEYERSVDRPQVWVALNSTVAGDEIDLGNYAQSVTWTFEIILRARSLREDLGIYNLHDLVCKALLGKRPSDGPGHFRLSQKRALQQNNREDGVFNYSLFLECPIWFFVENFDTVDDNLPELEKITLKNGGESWTEPRT